MELPISANGTRPGNSSHIFSPYSNTYAPVQELEKLYKEALSVPSVLGIAIGTRPDCIDREKLELLESLASSHFVLVEYGLQSIYDKTLEFIHRGMTIRLFWMRFH